VHRHYPALMPRRKGFTRALLQHLSHWLRERSAREEGGVGDPRSQKVSLATTGGKIGREQAITSNGRALYPQFLSDPIFVFRPKYLEA
jgi:hypothetical protein